MGTPHQPMDCPFTSSYRAGQHHHCPTDITTHLNQGRGASPVAAAWLDRAKNRVFFILPELFLIQMVACHLWLGVILSLGVGLQLWGHPALNHLSCLVAHQQLQRMKTVSTTQGK